MTCGAADLGEPGSTHQHAHLISHHASGLHRRCFEPLLAFITDQLLAILFLTSLWRCVCGLT